MYGNIDTQPLAERNFAQSLRRPLEGAQSKTLTEILNMTNEKAMIETLRTEAAKNTALGDVLHMLATRERARFMISLSALTVRMHREGFKGTRSEYGLALAKLATAGVGALDRDPKGRVRSLKDIKISLPTLGRAVLGEDQLKGFKQRNRYQTVIDVPTPVQVAHSAPASIATPPMGDRRSSGGWDGIERRRSPRESVGGNVVLTFKVNGRDLSLPLPTEMPATDVARLVERLKTAG